MRNLFAPASLALAIFAFASSAFAADPAPFQGRDENVLRLSGTMASYTKLDPISSAMGFGVDYGSYFANGFALVAQFRNQFSNSDYNSTSTTTTRSSASSRLYGFTPTYSLRSGASRMSFGLFLGAYSVSAQAHATSNVTVLYDIDASKTYFAIGPSATIDFFISNSVAISLGAILAATTVDPKPTALIGNFGLTFAL